MSTELGHTIDDVENLIKKHEAFEKSAAAQEERFSALERLTTVLLLFYLMCYSFTLVFKINFLLVFVVREGWWWPMSVVDLA